MQQSLEFDAATAATSVPVSVPVSVRETEGSATNALDALDPRRLDVYLVALDFHSRVSRLASGRGQAILRDQLSRASLSVVLNIAEGAGRVAPADKGRFYAMARGSACESAACLDVLERMEGLSADGRVARSLLVRIVQMLTRLGARMRADASA